MALLDAGSQAATGPTLFGLPMKQVSLITVRKAGSLCAGLRTRHS